MNNLMFWKTALITSASVSQIKYYISLQTNGEKRMALYFLV